MISAYHSACLECIETTDGCEDAMEFLDDIYDCYCYSDDFELDQTCIMINNDEDCSSAGCNWHCGDDDSYDDNDDWHTSP